MPFYALRTSKLTDGRLAVTTTSLSSILWDDDYAPISQAQNLHFIYIVIIFLLLFYCMLCIIIIIIIHEGVLFLCNILGISFDDNQDILFERNINRKHLWFLLFGGLWKRGNILRREDSHFLLRIHLAFPFLFITVVSHNRIHIHSHIQT